MRRERFLSLKETYLKKQCPKNVVESKKMDKGEYALAVGSLMYAMVCTRPDISFITGTLGRFQQNLSAIH